MFVTGFAAASIAAVFLLMLIIDLVASFGGDVADVAVADRVVGVAVVVAFAAIVVVGTVATNADHLCFL